jgi:hypothetical protein
VLYVGRREIKIVREAKPGDLDYVTAEARSAVVFVATGAERVVRDADINGVPTGVF